MKYKVGDKVRVGKLVKQSPDDSFEQFDNPEGKTGVVQHVDVGEAVCPYKVTFPCKNQWNPDRPVYPSFFAENELEAA